MSVVDLKELKKEFEAKALQNDLKSFAESQHKTIELLLLENKKMQEKLTQAESLLASLSGVHKISPEEMICIEQINILHNRSAQRELNLEEVKRLDLLVKNLRLVRTQSTDVIDSVAIRDVEEHELVKIASE
jgi:hypothetical protein